MTISSQDVRALSSSSGPGGVPLPKNEVERIAAVLNRSSSDRSATESSGNRSASDPDTHAQWQHRPSG